MSRKPDAQLRAAFDRMKAYAPDFIGIDLGRHERTASWTSRRWAPPSPDLPPLHGATDYRKRPDGVWEMPRDR